MPNSSGHSHDSYADSYRIYWAWAVPLVPKTLVLSLIVYTLKSVIWCPSATDGTRERECEKSNALTIREKYSCAQKLHTNYNTDTRTDITKYTKSAETATRTTSTALFQDSTNLQNKAENKQIKYTQ